VAVEQINLPAAAVKEETKDSAEKLERTVFIGNVPAQIAVNKSKLREFKRLLSGFGKLESIRFRSAAFQRPLKDTKTRKYAFNHGELHPERDSINAYAVYMDKSAVVKAISKLNGKEFEGHHLRVDSCCAAANESKASV
jgi:nucleolar protein 12